jgi:U3 small nucleolar RNA-associated protein 21
VSKQYVFCLSEGGHFTIFNTQSSEVIKTVQFDFEVTGMMHPLTYLNKLVFWGAGKMQIYNVMENECIYKFGEKDSAVLSVV